MSEPRVGGVLVTWNAARDLHALLPSLMEQSHPLARLIVVDNGSADDSLKLVREYYPAAEIIENAENLGFARATNQGLELLFDDCEFALTINQDLVLETDCVEKLLEQAAIKPDSASFQPLLLRLSSRHGDDPLVDSTGHLMFRDRVAINRGAGKPLSEVETESELFGVSAALALYRTVALKKVSPEGEVFCADFFSYFEDVDLDYRLLLAGFTPAFCTDARAWHAHAGSGLRRRAKIRLHGSKNRWLLLYRHESAGSLAGCWWVVFRQDLFSTLKSLVTDPLALLGGPLALGYLPRSLAFKRRFAPLVKLGPGELRGKMLPARPPGRRH